MIKAKRYIWLTLSALLIINLVRAQSSSCNCITDFNWGDGENYHYDELASLKNNEGHKIQICGMKEEKILGEDSASSDFTALYHLHTNFIVRDCKTGDTLFFQEEIPGSSMPYRIRVKGNTILLTCVTTFDELSSMHYPVPVNRIEISLKGNKAVVSKVIPMFQKPAFSAIVLDSAKRFYGRLEDTLKVHKMAQWIDYNQYPDGLLVIAALNNMGRAAELYRNLKKYFYLDGDVAESYDEGYLDFLLDNRIKK